MLSSQVICTGDVVAYCAEPEATVELLRRWGIHVVLGNCEESLGSGAPDCGCGFETGTVCSALSIDWYRFAVKQVGSDLKIDIDLERIEKLVKSCEDLHNAERLNDFRIRGPCMTKELKICI